eukprot:tig00001265_g7895.t1
MTEEPTEGEMAPPLQPVWAREQWNTLTHDPELPRPPRPRDWRGDDVTAFLLSTKHLMKKTRPPDTLQILRHQRVLHSTGVYAPPGKPYAALGGAPDFTLSGHVYNKFFPDPLSPTGYSTPGFPADNFNSGQGQDIWGTGKDSMAEEERAMARRKREKLKRALQRKAALGLPVAPALAELHPKKKTEGAEEEASSSSSDAATSHRYSIAPSMQAAGPDAVNVSYSHSKRVHRFPKRLTAASHERVAKSKAGQRLVDLLPGAPRPAGPPSTPPLQRPRRPRLQELVPAPAAEEQVPRSVAGLVGAVASALSLIAGAGGEERPRPGLPPPTPPPPAPCAAAAGGGRTGWTGSSGRELRPHLLSHRSDASVETIPDPPPVEEKVEVDPHAGETLPEKHRREFEEGREELQRRELSRMEQHVRKRGALLRSPDYASGLLHELEARKTRPDLYSHSLWEEAAEAEAEARRGETIRERQEFFEKLLDWIELAGDGAPPAREHAAIAHAVKWLLEHGAGVDEGLFFGALRLLGPEACADEAVLRVVNQMRVELGVDLGALADWLKREAWGEKARARSAHAPAPAPPPPLLPGPQPRARGRLPPGPLPGAADPAGTRALLASASAPALPGRAGPSPGQSPGKAAGAILQPYRSRAMHSTVPLSSSGELEKALAALNAPPRARRLAPL